MLLRTGGRKWVKARKNGNSIRFPISVDRKITRLNSFLMCPRSLRAGLVAFGLLMVCSSLACAFEVSSFSVSPAGSLSESCTPVSGSFTITSLSPETGDNNPIEGELFTPLDLPNWELVLSTGGRETARILIKNHTVFLSSLNFSGSGGAGMERAIHVSFSARLPDIQKTENMTILVVRQINRSLLGTTITEKFHYSPMLIDCACIRTACISARYLLEPFGEHIMENASRGVDTSEAEQKYHEAWKKMASAEARPSAETAIAISEYDEAQSAIAEGECLLDKAWAEKEIAGAQKQVDKTDTVISWFKGNRSTAMDAHLGTLIEELDEASVILAVTKDADESGNYAFARSKAQEAYHKANESYYHAISRRAQLVCDSCIHPVVWMPGGIFGIAAGIMAIVLLIAGIILGRKRKAVKQG